MNILITGASKGIGREVARSFALKPENHVIALSRNKHLLDKLVAACKLENTKSQVSPLVFDLENGNFEEDLFDRIQRLVPSLDIIINNAGLLINKPLQDSSSDDFDRMFNVNVKSVFRLTKTLLPLLIENSHIINISSMGGFQGSAKFPGLALYSASKGALAVLTETMAVELKEKKIKVNCLALGAVQTEMLAEAFPAYEAPVKPEQMARFISDFAVNGHHFFNGKILPVSVSTP
jgi:NAD(P)-dependent dehydrogenase (short-subunit alcohol dehydrogenase family)